MTHGSGVLCIEDPFRPENDVGKSSFGYIGVKSAFEKAYIDLVKYVRPNAPPPANGKR